MPVKFEFKAHFYKVRIIYICMSYSIKYLRLAIHNFIFISLYLYLSRIVFGPDDHAVEAPHEQDQGAMT